MSATKLIARALLPVALVLGLAASTLAPSAFAHTRIVLAGNQIVGGGEVNGYGVVDNHKIDDGPASDGTVIFVNADPEAHTLAGNRLDGSKPFMVTVPAGGTVEIKLDPGTYRYGSVDHLTMRGRIRVTGSH